MAILDNRDAGKLILRVTLGGLMLLHGIAKLRHGIDGVIATVEDKGLPSFVAYGVYIGEVVAPLFMIAGYMTRAAALVFAFNMVVAILLAHSGDVFRLDEHGASAIEIPLVYLMGGLSVAFLGAGRYSVSRGIGRWD